MTLNGIIISESAGGDGQDVDAICLGSGRFLRSVLVPFLSSNMKPAVFQTRGSNFLDSFEEHYRRDDSVSVGVVPSLCYPVDTVQFDGSTTTSDVEIYAAGTLGSSDGKFQLMEGLVPKMNCISVIGVGVTEAGMQNAENQCMVDLTELLHKFYCKSLTCSNPNGRICVINTDNVPNNGDVIRSHMLKNAERYVEEVEGGPSFADFISAKVAFLNSMVDRITSSRPDSDGLIPMCEPLPMKALVICDQGRDLPLWMDDADLQSRFGVKIRHDPTDLESDVSLKLRVANCTHTAVAHAMSLISMVNTEALCGHYTSSEVILNYLDSLYQAQILPGAVHDGISVSETEATWVDWRKRLQHPHFGLSTFFITQNGAAKCGIRLGPTIRSLVATGAHGATAGDHPLSVSMAFAVAAVLRFLTPASSIFRSAPGWCARISDAKARGIYVGWLDVNSKEYCNNDGQLPDKASDDTVTYADGLRYNLSEGWYEFRCDCLMKWNALTITSNEAAQGDRKIVLPDALSRFYGPKQPCAYKNVVKAYLLHPQGGNLQTILEGGDEVEELSRVKIFDTFVSAVCALYARMVSGDGIILLLKEMMENQHIYARGFATPCACLIAS